MVARRADPLTRFRLSAAVREALSIGAPVVALESAVITHGLPFPRNIDAALQMQEVVAQRGSVAATVAAIQGHITVGLSAEEIQKLGQSKSTRKLGIRDLASAALKGDSGGTTVAATMFVAHQVGIVVFATGGIGGVHRENAEDVSADLAALSAMPMIVVCAGAKAILDLPATLERLETMSVPVIGFQTSDFPAFYSRTSGLEVSERLDTADEIATYWTRHRELGMTSSLLIANPIPKANAMPRAEIDGLIEAASEAAVRQGIRGQALTPFLLQRLGELSTSSTIDANLALLINNARLASEIAVAITKRRNPMEM
jgi:pseudouridine-5'-phosphate glycosidase